MDGSADPQPLRLGGRYEVGEMLGRGGMAEVRLGQDVRLGREVAIKRLRTDLATDPSFQARFRREAQAAAGLNHPQIVSVYDTGEEMAPDGSHVQPYIVMEYVRGRTLREVLNDGRKLLPERALEIVSGVLSALDYSHRNGIVHRDIKPGNVMLTPSGDVKVMDFGIARAMSQATSTMTQTSAVVGTAQYLSPEQARGETVDSRSDIYSTGCLLFELLTGRPPFVGDSPFSVAYQHVREQAEPPSRFNPELEPALDAIVMKALAKRVDERYQSATEMLADIRRYLDGHPVGAPAPVVAPPVAAAEPEGTSIFRGPVAEYDQSKKRTWPVVLLTLLALLLLAGALFAGLRMFGDDTPQVAVPQVTGVQQDLAERRIRQAGLTVGEVELVNDEDTPKGQVVESDPGEGEEVDEGSAVDLVVSAGKADVVVKYVIGMTRAEATRVMQDLGLDVDYETRDSDEPRNTVIATDPNAGETVRAGSTVTLVLSEGQVEVPNVVGLPEDTARDRLEDAGFEVEVDFDPDTPSQQGTVLSQDPPGRTTAAEGSTVTIVVSSYEEPEPTRTPTPTPTPTAQPSPTQTSATTPAAGDPVESDSPEATPSG
jgi:beta-lactam-binding protein with PASTA domain/predicted Ser/Thr protein kinase